MSNERGPRTVFTVTFTDGTQADIIGQPAASLMLSATAALTILGCSKVMSSIHHCGTLMEVAVMEAQRPRERATLHEVMQHDGRAY